MSAKITLKELIIRRTGLFKVTLLTPSSPNFNQQLRHFIFARQFIGSTTSFYLSNGRNKFEHRVTPLIEPSTPTPPHPTPFLLSLGQYYENVTTTTTTSFPVSLFFIEVATTTLLVELRPGKYERSSLKHIQINESWIFQKKSYRDN